MKKIDADYLNKLSYSAKLIRSTRLEMGMYQDEFAEAVNRAAEEMELENYVPVSKGNVSSWERGVKIGPNREAALLRVLSDALGDTITHDSLYGPSESIMKFAPMDLREAYKNFSPITADQLQYYGSGPIYVEDAAGYGDYALYNSTTDTIVFDDGSIISSSQCKSTIYLRPNPFRASSIDSCITTAPLSLKKACMKNSKVWIRFIGADRTYEKMYTGWYRYNETADAFVSVTLGKSLPAGQYGISFIAFPDINREAL